MGTLWYGGNIYTLQQENDRVEAIFTRGDTIIALGKEKELRERYDNELDSVVDLQGSTLLPGFVDSHMHLIGHGEKLIRLDLSMYHSKSSALSALKEYAQGFSPGEWIIGEGWNDNLWDEPMPILAHEIDEVVPDHPVILKRICRHAIAANTQALELAAIDRQTICPPGGVIEKDEKGNPNGLLKDQAQEILLNVVPAVSSAYMEKAMRAAIADAHKLGLTGGHTEDLNYYGGFDQTYQAFQNVVEKEGYKFRAHLLVHHEVVEDMIHSNNHYLSGGNWIEFGAMKLFADGALGGRTALLSHTYADDPSVSGVAIFTQEQLDELILKARKYHMPVAIHVIGDLAFEMALHAIEKHPLTDIGRDRLIHAQILRKELIERAKRLPLILDIQPRFVASDFPWVIDRIGEERMNYCYAWKTLLDEGIPCAGGSDAPIEPLNPLLGIHAAVTRTNINDSDKTIYYKSQSLSVYEAVSLFTKGSAFAACHEHDRGMIQEGFAVDFTILKEDIFMMAHDHIPLISVDKTVIGGEVVFG
ncbi:amidohydrolase [Cytobacillus purgationiresistens]|uniref:Amidohydrolase YtcJ n=1 Tax=Cytobacillus purgationiresistens TaxID=863449 RepID=A0ABU0ALH0_9BACI|nr:amidohydrolase [Cytobacillus purgationiresistens]MDQ0272110.1 putative amidohydrolase YtcJ [Cytobacillus purgationiresistens]